jgi:hypothetical protein
LCKEEQLKGVIHQYRDEDIYNADKTALFYKLAPNKTLAFKGEWCSGGKHSNR